jgi:hypothetical protein
MRSLMDWVDATHDHSPAVDLLGIHGIKKMKMDLWSLFYPMLTEVMVSEPATALSLNN